MTSETSTGSNGRSFRVAFAGDRAIAARVLEFLVGTGVHPLAVMVRPDGTHADRLVELSGLPAERVLVGKESLTPDGTKLLGGLDLDYIICVHFPYIIPAAVLSIPRLGVLNLHPALLPYNRGWHTPSWAILDGTPYGATLHYMDEGLDTGDIIHQEEYPVRQDHTAHSLYSEIEDVERRVFEVGWARLATGDASRTSQDSSLATEHKRADLFDPHIQRIDPEETIRAGDLIRRLRGLTTNRIAEAAYLEVDGVRHRLSLRISNDDEDHADG